MLSCEIKTTAIVVLENVVGLSRQLAMRALESDNGMVIDGTRFKSEAESVTLRLGSRIEVAETEINVIKVHLDNVSRIQSQSWFKQSSC